MRFPQLTNICLEKATKSQLHNARNRSAVTGAPAGCPVATRHSSAADRYHRKFTGGVFPSQTDHRPVPMRRSIRFRRMGASQLQVIAENVHDVHLSATVDLTSPAPSKGEGESYHEISKGELVLSSTVGDSLDESVWKLELPADLRTTDNETTETRASLNSSQLNVDTSKEPHDLHSSSPSPSGRSYPFQIRHTIRSAAQPRRFWSAPDRKREVFRARKRHSEPLPRQLAIIAEASGSTPTAQQSSVTESLISSLNSFSSTTLYDDSGPVVIGSFATTTLNEEEPRTLRTRSRDIYTAGGSAVPMSSQHDAIFVMTGGGVDESKPVKSRLSEILGTKEIVQPQTSGPLSTNSLSYPKEEEGTPPEASNVRELRRFFECPWRSANTEEEASIKPRTRSSLPVKRLSSIRHKRGLSRRHINERKQGSTAAVTRLQVTGLLQDNVRKLQQSTCFPNTDKITSTPQPTRRRQPCISPSTSFPISVASSYGATSYTNSEEFHHFNVPGTSLQDRGIAHPSTLPAHMRRTRSERPMALQHSSSRKTMLRKQNRVSKLIEKMGITTAAEGQAKLSLKSRKEVVGGGIPQLLVNPVLGKPREQPESSTSFSVIETSAVDSLIVDTSVEGRPGARSLLSDDLNGSPRSNASQRSSPESEWYSCPSSTLDQRPSWTPRKMPPDFEDSN